ncbi:MAG TPA: nucleotidyltransferase domain-containing protein [Stellaceae bacterium]|nr:nucleotidyltransferase domain-containing protein [Stellaceae bacterium]
MRAAGIESVSIFGSVARGEETRDSDLDLVVRLDPRFREGGFTYFGRLDALGEHLREVLGRRVDLVAEPVRKDRLRREIARDAALAF